MGKKDKDRPTAVLKLIAKHVKNKPHVQVVKPKPGQCPPNCGLHNH